MAGGDGAGGVAELGGGVPAGGLEVAGVFGAQVPHQEAFVAVGGRIGQSWLFIPHRNEILTVPGFRVAEAGRVASPLHFGAVDVAIAPVLVRTSVVVAIADVVVEGGHTGLSHRSLPPLSGTVASFSNSPVDTW